MASKLNVAETSIPSLFVIDLVVHGDSRGWFKENYQKAKMEALGLPAFEIVQNNISFNKDVGVTRGLHAEPWDKYISVANGKVFGAWVDLRAGKTYGKVFTAEITPDKAVFVPKGVANGYQTLEQNVAYTYLVNSHWQPESQYVSTNLFDESLEITWPIDKSGAIVSDKDKANPKLSDIKPMVVS